METIVCEWGKINSCLRILSEVFKRFEGSYLIHTSTPTFEVFIVKSLATLLTGEYENLLNAIVESSLEVFCAIRQGGSEANSADDAKLKSIMDLISKVGAYEQRFKPRFLEEADRFYLQLRDRHLITFDIRAYLEEIECRLE